ncbi:MAG: sigma-70 family RNA polymerase sigma factor [Planctomycetaceae bacterium]|nr:sigma-70 family RNA polymerase sigma factor [Planctomycetaceae bacterium]
MSRYRSHLLGELAEQQVRFAPQPVRMRQIDSGEAFLLRVHPESEYAWAAVCRQITGYQPENGARSKLAGTDLAHDLRCFIEDLSESLGVDATDFSEPVLTVRQVSERFNVSEKTVDRWRNRGLASRKVSVDGKKRVVIPESTLARFVAAHGEEIDRGKNFHQLTLAEKQQLITEARDFAAKGISLTEASRVLARKYGRAAETVRYTLRDYDKSNPENAVFQSNGGHMTTENQTLMLDLYNQGISVADLARRFGKTKPAVHSMLAEIRIRRLQETPIDFMYSPEFEEPKAEQTICGPAPDYDDLKTPVRVPSNLPAYLAELYKVPLLNREQEQHYFRLMNYLRFRAGNLRDSLNVRRSSMKTVKQIESLLDEANDIKNLLTRSNLRLVVSIAKRHLKPGVNFFELVSDGNMSLIRAIEKFDYSRGNKFSTYASWAIMKNYARSLPAEHTRLDRFRTGCDEVFYDSSDNRASAFEEEMVNSAQRKAISEILSELDGRERKVISHRFGLTKGSEPETLEEVGLRLGVTKERVRQIEVRTLEKLRRIARRKQVDIPGI